MVTRFISILVFWLGLVLMVPTQADTDTEETMDNEHPPLCEVALETERAQFFFPILDIDQWRWFRSESQAEALEYAWEVMIPADKPEFIFGIYLPKPSKALQQEGTLQQILDMASWNAIHLAPDKQGGLSSQPLPNIKLNAELDDGGVVLTLLDKASIDQILGTKPTSALFNLLHPDELFTTSCTASIQYPQPGAAKKPARKTSGTKSSSWSLSLP